MIACVVKLAQLLMMLRFTVHRELGMMMLAEAFMLVRAFTNQVALVGIQGFPTDCSRGSCLVSGVLDLLWVIDQALAGDDGSSFVQQALALPFFSDPFVSFLLLDDRLLVGLLLRRITHLLGC